MTINNQNQLHNRLKLATIISIFIIGLFAFGYPVSADSKFDGVYAGDSDQNPNIALSVNIIDKEISGGTHLKISADGEEFNYTYTGTVTDTTVEKTSPQGDINGTVKGGAETKSVTDGKPNYSTSGAGTISGTIENNTIKFILDLNIIYGDTNIERQLTSTLTKQGEIGREKSDEEEVLAEKPQEPEEVAKQPDSGARFSSMTGQVEWRADDDPNGWKLCKLGTKLPVNAHIRTQEDSSAILSFSDISTFIMKAETEIVLESPPERDGKIKLAAGKIWMNIKKIVKDGSMEVDTNQAVCGIKGTTLALEELNGVSTLKVIEGKVLFTPKAGGGETMVEGGSLITATAQGIGTLEKFDAEKESKDWETLRAGGESVEKPVDAGKSAPALTGNSNKIIYFVIISGVIFAGIILAFIFKRKK